VDNLTIQAYAKLSVLIFLFTSGLISLILFIKSMKKSKKNIPSLIFRSTLFLFCLYFGLLSGIPGIKQIYDIRTSNFSSYVGQVNFIRVCPFEKGGLYVTIDEIDYVLIRVNDYGVRVGDYVSIEYGVVSKAIIQIDKSDDRG